MGRGERFVAVVVATRRGREELLLGRALPSVFRQEDVLPRAVVIVDDDARGQSPLEAPIRALQHAMSRAAWNVVVTPNRRTRGSSGTGAWNTGSEEARARLPHGGWIAFLDDDDAWRSTYLTTCLSAGLALGAALVVTGLLRIDALGVERQLAPHALRPELFFEGNPGVQASNLFIDLDLFEAVGRFDETLPSTTDRDLLIRVLDHLAVNPQPTAYMAEYLVEHHAHDGPRVTTDLRAKHAGLERFYARYASQMDTETLQASLERAERLFGYRRAVP